MKFFKFNPTGEQTYLERGQIINGLAKSMWVERYYAPGEFSFEAKLSTGLGAMLPLGTLISHINTLEVMIVENQEIKEAGQEDPSIVISGRSFVSYLENRIVGTNLVRLNSTVGPYNLTAQFSWLQIVKLINDHIKDTTNAADSIDDVIAITNITGTGVSVARTISRGTVWERTKELLELDDLGIKTVRKHTFGGSNAKTTIEIYKGVDRSATILFSWKAGHLDSVDYLFSQKDLKNAALVEGQYVYVMVDGTPDKYDRRTMLVSANDIDGNLTAVPTGPALTAILAAMTTRGQQALANQNQVTIGQADISKTTNYTYRRDYNIGDLVTIDGNFAQTAVMRVVEYAEIEDENGESGHPTLAVH